jgi:spermidine/putrescine transport system substrate-binding protein
MFGIIAGQMDFTRPAFANEEKLIGPLNVLAWNGYDDPQLIQGFKDLTGVDVRVKQAQSDSDQLSLVRAGTIQFDIVNPDAVWTTKFAQSGLTLPLDPAAIPSLDQMFPQFRNNSDIRFDGKMYGAPTRFGIDGIVHDLDKISAADAEDANMLWDPKLKERVSIIDWGELYIEMVGQWPGNPAPETATGALSRRLSRDCWNSSPTCVRCRTIWDRSSPT